MEVLLCFGPAVILVVFGTFLVPRQFEFASHPIDWQSIVWVSGAVICGWIGLFTLMYVLGKLFSNSQSISRPTLVCSGIALGLLPLSPAMWPDATNRWIGLLPIAATLHILFLSRRLLFRSNREAMKSILISSAAAISLPILVNAFPFGVSAAELRSQREIWLVQRPTQYEYTIQVNGWFRPDELRPKRISISNYEIVAATYARSDGTRETGDPVPIDSLWTIDRAFDDLLEAKRKGQIVNAKFNDQLGYVENASVDSGEYRLNWSVEVREFRASHSSRTTLD